MAISTKSRRETRIVDAGDSISKQAVSALNSLHNAVVETERFSAFINDPISANDIDADDRKYFSDMFKEALSLLNRTTPKIQRLAMVDTPTDQGGMPKEDFIAEITAEGLVLSNYSKNFG